MFFQYLLAMSGRSLRSRRLDTPLEAVHHVGDGNFGRETPRSSVVEIVEAFSRLVQINLCGGQPLTTRVMDYLVGGWYSGAAQSETGPLTTYQSCVQR